MCAKAEFSPCAAVIVPLHQSNIEDEMNNMNIPWDSDDAEINHQQKVTKEEFYQQADPLLSELSQSTVTTEFGSQEESVSNESNPAKILQQMSKCGKNNDNPSPATENMGFSSPVLCTAKQILPLQNSHEKTPLTADTTHDSLAMKFTNTNESSGGAGPNSDAQSMLPPLNKPSSPIVRLSSTDFENKKKSHLFVRLI
jgi:hypothetical protein